MTTFWNCVIAGITSFCIAILAMSIAKAEHPLASQFICKEGPAAIAVAAFKHSKGAEDDMLERTKNDMDFKCYSSIQVLGPLEDAKIIDQWKDHSGIERCTLEVTFSGTLMYAFASFDECLRMTHASPA